MAKSKTKPDPILVKDQLETLQGLYKAWGATAFTRYFVWIQTKRKSKFALKTGQRLNTSIEPFVFNDIQADIEKNIGQNNICLKPRQIGLTTWFLLRRIFVPALITTGTNGFLISQETKKASEHFSMVKRAYRFVGAQNVQDESKNDLTIALQQNLLHTAYSNKREIIFDQIGNTIQIASAEVEEAGQGSTLHHVVASEVARWPGKPEETLANIKEAIVLEGTLDLESTANGAGGYFYEEYFRAKRGESEFKAHFHQWWLQTEYSVPLSETQQEELEADLREDERQLINIYKLDLQQIAFRRAKQKSLRHNFEEKYPENDLTAFLIAGVGFFDREILAQKYLELQAYKPIKSFAGGSAKIYVRRIPGREYVIGADPASGKEVTSEKLDLSAASILDKDTGEQVASYRARLSPEDFALDLEEIGRYYNNAIIAVERGTAADAGGDGGTVIMTLKNQKYMNLYKHKEHWKDKTKNHQVPRLQDGVPMSGRVRPVALNKAKFIVETQPHLIHSVDLVSQCISFTRNEKGRPEATVGTHDDEVMAFAIAHLCRQAVLGNYDPLIGKKERYGDTPTEEREEEEFDD